MNFELKNIKHMPSLSHETYCYSATLYVNGKRSYTVENSGTGGSDVLRRIQGVTPASTEAEIESYFASLPGNQMLEFHCAGLVSKWLDAKLLKSNLKKSIVGILDGEVIAWKKPMGNVEGLKMAIGGKHKGVVFLDDLPFDDALKLFSDCYD